MKKKYIISLLVLILIPVVFSITLTANTKNSIDNDLEKSVEKYEFIDEANGKNIIKRKGAYITKKHTEYNYINHKEIEEILTYDHSEVTDSSEMDMYSNVRGDVYGYDVSAGKFTYMFKRFDNLEENNQSNKLEEKDILQLAEEFIKDNLSFPENYKLENIYFSEDANTFYTTFYAYINEYKLSSFCVVNFTVYGEIKNYLIKDGFEKFLNFDNISIDLYKQNKNILMSGPDDGYEKYEIMDTIIDVLDNNIYINYYIYFYKGENCVPKIIQIEYNNIRH